MSQMRGAAARTVAIRGVFGRLDSRPLRRRYKRRGIEGGWDEGGQEEAPKGPQPSEDAAEVVADGGEDDVGGIAGAALEIAATEVAFGLQVADHGLDGGSASQLALDHSEDAALLAGDEDAAWILCVVAAVSLVDIGPLDRTSGQCLGIKMTWRSV
jgi:hypothetical protein